VKTRLAEYHEYKRFDSWAVLQKVDADLKVRIGIPKNFSLLTHFVLKNPHRLAIKLYHGKHPFSPIPKKAVQKAPLAAAPVDSQALKAPSARSAGSQKNPSKSGYAGTKPVAARPGVEDHLKNNGLLTLNFYQGDIRELLSALAMKRELNISMSPEVAGNVSVHLNQVSLSKALDAITLAGGFGYQKLGDLYYVYKPKEGKELHSERLQMRIFKLKYVDVDKAQDILGTIPGMRMLKIHKPTRTLIVEDFPENIAKVESILNNWDIMPKQVMIEAKILEVELTDDMSLGVDWEKVLGTVRIGTGGFTSAVLPTTESVSPVPSTGTGIFGNLIAGAGTNHQFAAALDALQTKTRINTLSTPKIMAIHGQPARVQVGGQQGYRVTTVSNGIATETIEFIDTGTILDITPHIVDEDHILLDVAPSIDAARIEEGGIPVVKTTTVKTTLLARNGETIFIGGLIQDSKTTIRDMVPCFGDIPILAPLFGRTFRGIGKAELVVMITPQLLDDKLRRIDEQAIAKTRETEEILNKEPLPPKEVMQELMFPQR
jgi:type II secretory pathway component GspD/PulD (secretin)